MALQFLLVHALSLPFADWSVGRSHGPFVFAPAPAPAPRTLPRSELLKLRRAKDSGVRTVTTLRAAATQSLKVQEAQGTLGSTVIMRRPYTGPRRDASTQTAPLAPGVSH